MHFVNKIKKKHKKQKKYLKKVDFRGIIKILGYKKENNE